MAEGGPVADELVANLERDVELVDDGALTIDAARALDKLGRFQLSDPHHYVLRLAEAGVRLGSDALWFWTSSGSLIAHFEREGEPVTLPETTLAQLLTVLFADAESTPGVDRAALVQLAVAANAARQLRPQRLWIESVDAEGGGHRLMLEDDQQRVVPLAGATPGLWFRLHDRPAPLPERMRNGLFARPEKTLLRRRACWASTPIYVDGWRISHGLDHDHTTPLDDPRGFLSMVRLSDAPRVSEAEPTIVLLSAGIEVERVHPPGARLYMFAVVEAELERDLSLERFIRGPRFNALVNHVVGREDDIEVVEPKHIPQLVSRSPLRPIARKRLATGTALGIAGLALLFGQALTLASLWPVGVALLLWSALQLGSTLSSDRHRPWCVQPLPTLVEAEQRLALPPAPD